jgi:hypothetical protein
MNCITGSAVLRMLVAGGLLATGLATTSPAWGQTPIGETKQQPMQVRALADSKVALQNGAMTSAVELSVPAFHGITPQLSLSYSSSSGNGFVGVGWDLRGFSVIERVSPSRGSPRLAQAWGSDSYLLDGEELVASAAMGGNYGTRRESFLRITGFGSGANWTVVQRDGTTLTYSPIFSANSVTLRWGLTKVQDTHGNIVTYGWQCETTTVFNPTTAITLDCVPASVSYATTTITIFKESRPDPETFATGNRLGRSNYRLKSVSVNVGGILLRAYKLSYLTSARTSNSVGMPTSMEQAVSPAAPLCRQPPPPGPMLPVGWKRR